MNKNTLNDLKYFLRTKTLFRLCLLKHPKRLLDESKIKFTLIICLNGHTTAIVNF